MLTNTMQGHKREHKGGEEEKENKKITIALLLGPLKTHKVCSKWYRRATLSTKQLKGISSDFIHTVSVSLYKI